MTEKPQYPERKCDVEVEFVDGQVQTYRIDASIQISSYLAREIGQNGVLMLMLPDRKTVCIPVGQIKSYSLTEVPVQEASNG